MKQFPYYGDIDFVIVSACLYLFIQFFLFKGLNTTSIIVDLLTYYICVHSQT